MMPCGFTEGALSLPYRQGDGKIFQRRAQRRRKLLTPDPVDDMPIVKGFSR